MDSNTTDIEKSEHPLMPSIPADPVSEIVTTATLLDEQNNDKEQVENETQPKVPRKRSLHFWKLLVSSLTVVAVLQLAGLLVLTVAWRNKRNQALLLSEQTLCVPCNVIQDTSDTIPEDFDIKPDALTNVTNCCNSVSTVLKLLINKQTAEQFYDGYASRLFSENADCPNVQKSKPAAMLAGIALENMGCQHKKKVKPAASVFGLLEHRRRRTGYLIHWNINSQNSFQRGVHYGRGFLEIKQSGFYYIFSQIKFRSDPRHSVLVLCSFNPDISRDYKTDSDDDMTHRHYMLVLSQSSESERVLLESYKSTCGISEVREFTSAVGAVFYLNENDKLLVRTSHPQHLVACNHTNNFGVYMV